MKISKRGIELIKGFEGCVLTAYQDAVGVWTIGYGHTRGVKQGQVISGEQAERYLIEDCETFENNVNSFDSIYHWNQNEFDALVSFAFNIGSINQLTANGTRSRAEIAEKIPEYIKAGGRVLEGLKKRRQKERELFLTPVGMTQEEVKEYALAATDWIYVWGADGKPLTQAYADELYEAYGNARYNRSYYDDKVKEAAGGYAADCSGFLYPLSGSDNTADGYYRAALEKGTIDTLPEDDVCLIFKQNAQSGMYHVGIYLGDGTVAEMNSSETNYKHWPLLGKGYTHWAKPIWIDYTSQKGGWEQDGSLWSFIKENGEKAKDEWIRDGGRYYVFDGAGRMITGWFLEGTDTYYYMNPADGAMLADQWTDELEGKYYYLTPSGKMAKNAFVKSKTQPDLYHFVGTDGAWMPERDINAEDLSIY